MMSCLVSSLRNSSQNAWSSLWSPGLASLSWSSGASVSSASCCGSRVLLMLTTRRGSSAIAASGAFFTASRRSLSSPSAAAFSRSWGTYFPSRPNRVMVAGMMTPSFVWSIFGLGYHVVNAAAGSPTGPVFVVTATRIPRAPHVDSGFLADRPSFAAGIVTLNRAVLLALMVLGSGAAVMGSSPLAGLKSGAIVVSVLWGLARSAHVLTESVELRIWVDMPTCSVGVFSSSSPLRTVPLMDRVPLSSSHGVIEVISTPGFWTAALSFSSVEAEVCS